ncbi:MAG: Type 4 prepilin-like protein leader peptide-processing enzyme [Candidatus Shapirobacteria bacterium GW2011_GWE1_38_10]|uniref:Type 4 prepilin-like protein leader peptide-processing enzyme n=1 Tax=Candidatus Shapirobacteria bacterium GW2011_GWE1_38_10 TaxID=1618488 RepID=A0A0G0KMA7_9BACT|nr:MAG: Type 4 prepilin-like protein leader peptide-processing enzyme [Candidatus Shapirobacteria bacterium GW2011_GWE1_38_10]KKQ65152.1 MAG: Type 4 prepilin-like protein leader peptide-processing enzyme [Candidatus Shapirobacteria bacterium GW2011_GWF1_38_23]
MALWRVGNNKSLLKEKRSYCDFCKKKLKWYDNVPVLSFLIYKGKSRCCGKKLSPSYPIVEILTGIIFVLNFYYSTTYLLLFLTFIILGLLVFEAAFDFKYMTLPDLTAFLLIGLALLRWLVLGTPKSFLVSALISGLFILLLHKIKIRGHEAMGDGDILLAVFMGLFLGFPNIVVAFYIAFVMGAIVGGFLILKKIVGRLTPIPFGPFLILGTVVAFWWGEKIIRILEIRF